MINFGVFGIPVSHQVFEILAKLYFSILVVITRQVRYCIVTNMTLYRYLKTNTDSLECTIYLLKRLAEHLLLPADTWQEG